MCLCLGALLASSAVFADVDEDIEELNDRVDELELKTAKNKVSIFGDFRIRYDSLKWHVAPYQQMMGFDFTDPMNPAPVYMAMPASEKKNDEAWAARLRLKLDAKIASNLHFTGRLNMNRGYGAASVPLFNGSPNTVMSGFNSVAVPTDDVVHVERAAVTWEPESVPLVFTLGRQAATGGPPREIREDKVRQGTPGAMMIDAQIDGSMIGMRLDKIGLPEEGIVRVCYGTGFESGFGSGGHIDQTYVNLYLPNANYNPMDPSTGEMVYTMPMPISGLKDSKVAGICGESPITAIPGDNLFSFGYFKMLDMIDIPSATTRGFPNGMSTQAQTLTATANLGDMDLYGFCWQHTLEFEEYELDYFASVAFNKSHPEAGTASAYGFGPMLGNDSEDLSGSAWFVGARGDVPPTGGKLGLEYNHGDENWFAYLPAADDVNSKLSTRGSVLEAYYIHPLQKNCDLRVGFQSYKYDYAFSGWHISPAPIEYFDLANNPQLPYAFPDEITNIYAVFDVTF